MAQKEQLFEKQSECKSTFPKLINQLHLEALRIVEKKISFFHAKSKLSIRGPLVWGNEKFILHT